MAKQKLERSTKGKVVGFTDASFYRDGVAGLGGICYIGERKQFHYSEFCDWAKTSNQAEYYSMAVMLTMAHKAGLDRINVYADSLIVVEQLNNRFTVNEPTLLKIRNFIQKELIPKFVHVNIYHVHREENRQADYFAGLATGKYRPDKRLPDIEYFWTPRRRSLSTLGSPRS